MFDIGLQELVVIFVIALLVFGPKNLPQLGRSLGRALREFRRASDEFRSTIETNLKINDPDPPPVVATESTSASAEASAPPPVSETLPESGIDAFGMEGTGEAPPAPVGEPYLAQRGAKLFHARDCGWAKRIAEPERIYFKRVADAKEAGFAGCPVCDPWEPA